jgi:tetratricopeptide (TPR) repeat protein
MRTSVALTLYVSLCSVSACFVSTANAFVQEALAGSPASQQRENLRIRQSLVGGDYTGAEKALRKAIEDRGADSPATADLRTALGDLMREQGKDGEASALFSSVLHAPQSTWKQQMVAHMGIAGIEGSAGATETSVAGWNNAISLARNNQDALAEAIALRGLADTWLVAGETSKADPLLRRSHRMLESNPDTKPWQMAATLMVMGDSYRAQDKLAMAEDAWSRALDLERKAFGESHPQVAFIMGHLSDVYSARKQFDLAREYAARAVDVMKVTCGENSLAVAAALTNAATVEQRANALQTAADTYDKALRIARTHPENSTLGPRIVHRYVTVLKAIHRDRDAKALALEAKTFQRQ